MYFNGMNIWVVVISECGMVQINIHLLLVQTARTALIIMDINYRMEILIRLNLIARS